MQTVGTGAGRSLIRSADAGPATQFVALKQALSTEFGRSARMGARDQRSATAP